MRTPTLTDPDAPRRTRWTLVGMAVVGGLFFAVSLWRSVSSGGDPLDHWAPIGALTLIGVTVGMLVGPLMGGLAARLRGR